MNKRNEPMKRTILLVDDEEDTANLVNGVPKREGLMVIQGREGRHATTLVETRRPAHLSCWPWYSPLSSDRVCCRSAAIIPIGNRPRSSSSVSIPMSLIFNERWATARQRISWSRTGRRSCLRRSGAFCPPRSMPHLRRVRVLEKNVATAPRKQRPAGCHRPRKSQRKNRAA